MRQYHLSQLRKTHMLVLDEIFLRKEELRDLIFDYCNNPINDRKLYDNVRFVDMI